MLFNDSMKTLSFVVNGETWTFGEQYDYIKSNDGGFYVNAVVSEPAEWAAIFGVIALAFVAYRRRK